MPTCYDRTRLASLTDSRKSSCTRVSSVSSGWKVATRKRPCRRRTGSPSSLATTSPPSPGPVTRRAPSRRSIAACSRKFPCRARTPIFIRRILDFGQRRPGSPREEQRKPDEHEPRDGERHRTGPLVRVALAISLVDEAGERDEGEE